MSLESDYRRYFRAERAVTPELIREAQRIRYEVYCREFQFEDDTEHPDGLERDEYDLHSRHCVIYYNLTSKCVGCVRLVLANPAEPNALFPFEKNCGDSLRRQIFDPGKLPRDSIGEISRLAIRKEFRRRRGEAEHPDGVGDDIPRRKITRNVKNRRHQPERRHTQYMVLGLYLAAAATALSSGLESVFAMMEPRLARHLIFAGIRFEQVGDVVDYHGPRAAFHITRRGLYQHLNPEVKSLLDTIGAELDASEPSADYARVQLA